MVAFVLRAAYRITRVDVYDVRIITSAAVFSCTKGYVNVREFLVVLNQVYLTAATAAARSGFASYHLPI